MLELSEREFAYLMDSIAEQESGYNPEALSPAGAQGMYQIMPATAHELYAEMLCGRQYNPWDADLARYLASRYVRKLLRRYSNDIRLSLAAYNWGMGSVGKALDKARAKFGSKFSESDKFEMIRPFAPSETKDYVSRVVSFYNRRIKYLTPKGLNLLTVSGESL